MCTSGFHTFSPLVFLCLPLLSFSCLSTNGRVFLTNTIYFVLLTPFLPWLHLSICCLFIWLRNTSVSQSIRQSLLSVSVSVYLSVCLCVCLSLFTNMSAYSLPVCVHDGPVCVTTLWLSPRGDAGVTVTGFAREIDHIVIAFTLIMVFTRYFFKPWMYLLWQIHKCRDESLSGSNKRLRAGTVIA